MSPAARASGSGLATEQSLFHAYRRSEDMSIETRPCACGGLVHADPMSAAKGVQAHNYTGRHRAWRDARGDDDPGTWQES